MKTNYATEAILSYERVRSVANANAKELDKQDRLQDRFAAIYKEHDELLERMQTPQARKAAASLFNMTGEELGAAAVEGAKKRKAMQTHSTPEEKQSKKDIGLAIVAWGKVLKDRYGST